MRKLPFNKYKYPWMCHHGVSSLPATKSLQSICSSGLKEKKDDKRSSTSFMSQRADFQLIHYLQRSWKPTSNSGNEKQKKWWGAEQRKTDRHRGRRKTWVSIVRVMSPIGRRQSSGQSAGSKFKPLIALLQQRSLDVICSRLASAEPLDPDSEFLKPEIKWNSGFPFQKES